MARVTPVIAIATVLLCGATGAVLGSLYPVESLKRHPEAPAKATVTPAAPVTDDINSKPAVKEPKSSAAAAPPVVATTDELVAYRGPQVPKETPAVTTVAPPPAAPTDDIASSTVPKEQPAARDDTETPASVPQPEIQADTNPLPAQKVEPAHQQDLKPPPAPPKATRKVAPVRAAAAEPKRARRAAQGEAEREPAVREEPPPKRSMISQLPFIGPLFAPVTP